MEKNYVLPGVHGPSWRTSSLAFLPRLATALARGSQHEHSRRPPAAAAKWLTSTGSECYGTGVTLVYIYIYLSLILEISEAMSSHVFSVAARTPIAHIITYPIGCTTLVLLPYGHRMS